MTEEIEQSDASQQPTSKDGENDAEPSPPSPPTPPSPKASTNDDDNKGFVLVNNLASIQNNNIQIQIIIIIGKMQL